MCYISTKGGFTVEMLTFVEQEYIPVGCVPAAHWPYAAVCFLGCLVLGGFSLAGGVLPGRGGVLPGRGGSPWRGVVFPGGGVVLPGRGGGFSLLETPPVNRMTDRCKNITLATTSLRPVIIICSGMNYWKLMTYKSMGTFTSGDSKRSKQKISPS